MTHRFPKAANPLALSKLINGTDAVLSTHAFHRTGMYWRNCMSKESISILHFHCTEFVIEIELAAYVYGIREPENRKPTMRSAHACISLSSLALLSLARYSMCLSNQVCFGYGESLDDQAIVDEALVAIRTVATPILLDLLSLEGLRRQFRKYGDRRWIITPELRRMLYGSSAVDIPGEIPWQPWELGESSGRGAPLDS